MLSLTFVRLNDYTKKYKGETMSKIKKREEIDDKYKWDLSKIYKNNEEINNDIKKVKELANDFLKYKGKLVQDSNTLLKATDEYFSLIRIIDKLISYSHMKSDEDKSVAKNEELVGKIDRLSDEISEMLAFYSPELLSNDYEKVNELVNNLLPLDFEIAILTENINKEYKAFNAPNLDINTQEDDIYKYYKINIIVIE